MVRHYAIKGYPIYNCIGGGKGTLKILEKNTRHYTRTAKLHTEHYTCET